MTDEAGWSVEGVEISNYFPSGSNSQKTYTDADGRYRFAVHRGYVIVATKGGFAPVFHEFRREYLAKYHLPGNWRTGPDRRGPIVVNLTLRSGVTVTGTVRSTQGGEPAAGARVHLERRARDTDVGLNKYTIWQSDAARTDDRGRFAFEHVPSGIVWVFADGVREETLAVKENGGGKIVCDITTSGDRARQTPAQPARPG